MKTTFFCIFALAISACTHSPKRQTASISKFCVYHASSTPPKLQDYSEAQDIINLETTYGPYCLLVAKAPRDSTQRDAALGILKNSLSALMPENYGPSLLDAILLNIDSGNPTDILVLENSETRKKTAYIGDKNANRFETLSRFTNRILDPIGQGPRD